MSWDTILSDIGTLAEQFSKEETTERASDFLRTHAGKFANDWHERRQIVAPAGGVPIPPPRDSGLHPKGCEVSEAFILFNFELGQDPQASGSPARADFQVRVVGCLLVSNDVVDLEDHWRVDTHVYSGCPSTEPHPLFHFQRGGHAQDNFATHLGFVPGDGLPKANGSGWRGLLQSPGPRIPMLPMCPVLAIDFAISQHNGTIWQRLRSIPEYSALIRVAQDRIWTPLFDSLAVRAGRRRWMGSSFI